MDNNNLLFSFPKKGVYYFDGLDSNRINCTYTILDSVNTGFVKSFHCFMARFFAWLPFYKHINERVCAKYYNPLILERIKNNKGLVIYDTYLDADLLYFIKSHNKDNKVFIFIWNNISKKRATLFSRFVDKNRIYSYSKDQANEFGFQYHNDVLLTSMKLEKEDIVRDFYFLGADKQREVMLDKLGDVLNGLGYTYLFEIWGEDNPKYPNITFFKKYIPYDEYLRKVSSSRCIVDIVTHHNITFRTIESFVFNKKLISNNAALKEYDFYNDNNIFIIDFKDENLDEKIVDFLNKPIVKIDNEIISRYDIYSLYDFFKAKLEE